MAFLIENLVKMSRLENGIVAVHPVKQDIAVLMESLVGIFEKNEERRIFLIPLTEVRNQSLPAMI